MPEMVTPEELAIINQRFAKEPLVAAYCIPMMAADTNRIIDSRALKLDASTIAKYAKDAQERGPNLQLAHASFMQPIPLGKVFAGVDVQGKLFTKAYMPVGVTVPNVLGAGIKTDDIAAAYATGLADRVSIGFSFERAECNICFEDVRSPTCPHVPGQMVEGDAGPIECTPVIFAGDSGLLQEISLVWQGALDNAKTIKRSDLPTGFGVGETTQGDAMFAKGEVPALAVGHFSVVLPKSPAQQAGTLHAGEATILALSHNSTLARTEPTWGTVDKTKLPRNAFAEEGAAGEKMSWKYPHHFVQNGGGENAMGCYTTGEMYLHRSGLRAAMAAAGGARSGQEASSTVKAHLDAHAKAIGMGQHQLALIETWPFDPVLLLHPTVAMLMDVMEEGDFEAICELFDSEVDPALGVYMLEDCEAVERLTARVSVQSDNIAGLMSRVAALEPIAAIGAVYMESVKADALAAGVKLMGNAFNVEFYEKVFGEALVKGEVSVVQQAAEAWGSELALRFPAGRQTIEPDPARSEATVTASTPDAQFDQLVRATLKAEKWEFDRYGDAAIAVGKAHPALVAAMRAQTAPSHAE